MCAIQCIIGKFLRILEKMSYAWQSLKVFLREAIPKTKKSPFDFWKGL